MHFEPGDTGRLVLRDADTVLAEYVYEPTEPQLESPRPYLLLRTRDGRDVTAYRPDDHVWHKGLSLALPVVGAHNFWGGPTYVHGEGYVQLANNGAQVHTLVRGIRHPLAEAAGGSRASTSASTGSPSRARRCSRGAHDHRARGRRRRVGAHVAQRAAQ